MCVSGELGEKSICANFAQVADNGKTYHERPLQKLVYQFMDRRRAEGKPYRVYMMAFANTFLRIYYATVNAYLESLEHAD